MRYQHAKQHQGQEQVVVQRHRGKLEAADHQFFAQIKAKEMQGVDLADPLGAVGDIDGVVQVVQKHADDFAKTQGHNGQIVAAQAQGRCAQQDTQHPSQSSGQGQSHPNRRVHALREHGQQNRKGLGQLGRVQQAIGIGANGKKGHVTEVEQSGITHHDVQPQGQQYIEQRHVRNAHPGIAKLLQTHGQHQQRQRGQRKKEESLLLFHATLLRPGRPHVRPTDPRGARSAPR